MRNARQKPTLTMLQSEHVKVTRFTVTVAVV
jgi:hypothetical protein